MRFFLYCSPHYYYRENLRPIAKGLKAMGNEVVFSSHDINHIETVFENDLKLKSPLEDFIKKKVNYDAVLLTQSWWLNDKRVANSCVDRGIPFFILEHAPQMVQYRVVKYRSHLNGGRAHFMWGKESQRLMRESGCSEELPVMGSPRLERMKSIVADEKLKLKYSGGREIISIYTTSAKMMSPNFNKRLSGIYKEIMRSDKYNLVLKDHVKFNSRKMVKGFNSERVKVFSETDRDLDFLKISDYVLFCFPSSVMIPAFYFGKPIYSLYRDHHVPQIKNYSKKHKSIIGEVGKNFIKDIERFHPNKTLYSEWLDANLKLDGDPVKDIIQYVMERI